MNKNVLFVNLRPQKVERVAPLLTAKQMGINVILLADVNPQVDSHLITDIIVTDTYDQEEVLKKVKEFNKRNKLDGVVTWSDKDVELVARIGKELNLPTVNVEASKVARNKYLMRQEMSKVEGLCPKFLSVRGFEDLKLAVQEIGKNGILKPVGASGSKAIFKISEDTNLREVFDTLIEVTSPDKDKVYTYYPYQYVYEEYLDGPEVTVDGVVQDNKVYIAGVTDKKITDEHSLEYAAFFPSNKEASIIKEIKSKTELAVKALGINNSAFHLECRVTSEGVRILECAARSGGGFVTSHLIDYASEYSFQEQVLNVALGIPVEWKKFDEISTGFVGSYFSFAKKTGKLVSYEGLDEAMEVEGIKYVIPNIKIGKQVDIPPNDVGSILVSIVGKSNEYDELVNSLELANEKLTFIIE